MTPEDLKQLASQVESEVLEFKTGIASVYRTAPVLAAFANTAGGTLVVGIADQGSIVGVEDPVRAMRIIENAAKHISPPLHLDTQTIEVDGSTIIVVEIPRGDKRPHLVDEHVLQRVGERIIDLGASYAPNVRGSAYQAVLGGVDNISQGVGGVTASEGGVTIGSSRVAGRDIHIQYARHSHPTELEKPTEVVIPYDAAFERVAGSTAFVLDQLEASYRQTREPSQGWYRFSAIAASVGFLLMVGGVIVLLGEQITAGIITSIAGVIPEAAAALFFVQGKNANRRVDSIQEKLGEARELLTALEIANTITDEKEKNEMKRSIVLKALGLEKAPAASR